MFTDCLADEEGKVRLWTKPIFRDGEEAPRPQMQKLPNGKSPLFPDFLLDSEKKHFNLEQCKLNKRGLPIPSSGVLTGSSGKPLENHYGLFNPEGKWHKYNSANAVSQGRSISGTRDVNALDETPVSWTGSLVDSNGEPIVELDSFYDANGNLIIWKNPHLNEEGKPIPGTSSLTNCSNKSDLITDKTIT
jgi:hypothetical protein